MINENAFFNALLYSLFSTMLLYDIFFLKIYNRNSKTEKKNRRGFLI